MDETRTPPSQVQQPLPFDDESDRPVPYSLTARARREVAPEALPDLELVTDTRLARPHAPSASIATPVAPETEDGALDSPGDTRPSRARALRRAGLSVEAIARQLDADELAVRAWLGGLAGRSAPHRVVVPPPGHGDGSSRAAQVHLRSRRRARLEAAERLRSDPAFAAGLGLVAGIADVDDHSVAVTTRDPRVAGVVTSWLLTQTATPPHRLRVVLRLGRGVAADLARHRWAEALGLDVGQITHTRVAGVPELDEEALLRVGDPATAGAVAGWAQALLDPPSPEPVDAAF
jgi:hypothetical protein